MNARRATRCAAVAMPSAGALCQLLALGLLVETRLELAAQTHDSPRIFSPSAVATRAINTPQTPASPAYTLATYRSPRRPRMFTWFLYTSYPPVP